MRSAKLSLLCAAIFACLVAPSAASASALSDAWMIGPLPNLQRVAPVQAARFFDRADAFKLGGVAPSGWPTHIVHGYKSFADYKAHPTPASGWVLYDIESWDLTPLVERNHPLYYMKRFVRLAHSRGQKVILTPARDLVYVRTAYCHIRRGETATAAYYRCGYARAAARSGADVFEIQAQALQASGARVYASFVACAARQARAVRPGVTVWAGLTTDRGDSAWVIYKAYEAAKRFVDGWWMNTNASTVAVAGKFFRMI